MTGKLKFFYNGILLSAVGLSMRTVGLALGAYISRKVGAEGVGLNTLIMSVYAFALTFATAGISLSVTALVAAAIGEGESGKSGRVLRGAVYYALIFSSAATAILILLSGVIGEHVLADRRAITSLIILAFSLIPASLSAVITGYFVGVRRVAFNAFLQISGQILKVTLTVVLLIEMSKYGIEYAVAALCIGTTLTEIILFILALFELMIDRHIGKYEKTRGADFVPMLKMALPLALSAYIRSALLTLEHSLIPKRLIHRGESSSEALSSYGFLHGMALQVVLYPLVPLSSFSGLLLPEFSEAKAAGKKSRMEHIASSALGATMIYSIAAAVLLFIFSEEIGYAVFGSYEAGKYIAILSPVVPIMYLDHVADSMLKGIGEQVYSMWVNIFDAFLSVILVYLLIPVFGISGYALIIIAMEIFNFTFSIIRLKKRISFKIYPLSSIVFPVISMSASAGLVTELFLGGGSSTTLPLLGLKILFSVSVFLCCEILLYRLLGAVKPAYKKASNTSISEKPSKRA